MDSSLESQVELTDALQSKMTNRFNKPVSTRIRNSTQENDAQLAYRLQNEEFKSMYNKETRHGNMVDSRIENQPASQPASQPAQVQPAQNQPAQTEHPQIQPIQTEPIQIEPTQTELYQTDNNINADDLTEILVDGGTEIRNRELSDHEFALKLQERYTREDKANNQRNIFTSVQQ